MRVWLVLSAWRLIVSGDMSLDEWEPLIVEALWQRFPNHQTARKAVREVKALFRFLRALGITRLNDVTTPAVVQWIWAAGKNRSGRHYQPSISTARNKRLFARTAFEEAKSLGAQIDPAALVGERILKPSDAVSARPLTDDEFYRVQVFGDCGPATSGRAVMVAFSEAGATPLEAAGVRMRDIDLDAGTVAFLGPAARINPLSEWGRQTVKLFLENRLPLAPDDLVCLAPWGARACTAQSVNARLRRVLIEAELLGLPGVTVRSIRLTGARRELEAHGIEAAARFVGTPSLDTAAEALGHNWRHDA